MEKITLEELLVLNAVFGMEVVVEDGDIADVVF